MEKIELFLLRSHNINMKIIKQADYIDASNILKNGGLVAFPTETVFGFGVVYDNENSYQKLVQVKRRPPEKPFTLMLGNINDIEKYAQADEKAKKLIKKFMPGQFTIILQAKSGMPSWAVAKDGTVGIRVPDFPLISKMINSVGKPLLVPSANRSGEAPICNSDDIISTFEGEIDAVIRGESTSKTPSTVVFCKDEVKILREGLISSEDIKKALEE